MIRARDLARRAAGAGETGGGLIIHGSITFDVGGFKLSSAGRSAYLTAQQARLLAVLMAAPRDVHTTEALSAVMRENGSASDDALKVCISRLRGLLRLLGEESPFLVSVRGIGYIFDARSEA